MTDTPTGNIAKDWGLIGDKDVARQPIREKITRISRVELSDDPAVSASPDRIAAMLLPNAEMIADLPRECLLHCSYDFRIDANGRGYEVVNVEIFRKLEEEL